MSTNLIIPMAGAGDRFLKNGYVCPKPLIELRGKPFFYWAVESLYDRALMDSLGFVVLRDHVERFSIDRVIRSCYPEARIHVLDRVLPGAVLTCMAGAEALGENDSVIFNDCDHYFRAPALGDFLSSGNAADGALLTFESDRPAYSFLEYDGEGFVKRTVEKQAISTHAICGAYYFKSKALFLETARAYLESCTYSEYFMSGVYNELIARGGRVKGIPTRLHISFGTPEEYLAAQTAPGLAGSGL